MQQQEKESSSHPAANGHFDVRIADLDPSALDALPLGVIRLDRHGVVTAFNAHEERKTRRSRADVLGRHFFHDVAPCARVQSFHGRFLEGVANRRLDTTFGFVFPFSPGERHVMVTLFYRTADDSVWIVLRDTNIRRA
jgi:photoactive yellow protein